jgi:cytochrome c biogenesis protein
MKSARLKKSAGVARNVRGQSRARGNDMAETFHARWRELWQTMGAIKTGVILLILVVIFSAAGTVILQRPATEPDEMQRAYSPQMLRALDALRLTDVFHAWWFVLLLLLVSLSIVAASIQRFPNSWRFYARPYKSPDEAFRKALALHSEIAVDDAESGLAAAERVLGKAGLRPEHIVREDSCSLFGERHRISEMAVYIVHASLLLIFFGGIVDALYGWSGFLMLSNGQQSSAIELRNGKMESLPFAIRCDGAGQENYADGTPKRWWSKLAVVSAGREVLRKEIVVNDPLVYRGVRFYQASYGETGKMDTLKLTATPTSGAGEPKAIALHPEGTVALDADTEVRVAEFIPDYVIADGRVYARSTQVVNPAVHLIVESKSSGKTVNVWLPPLPGFAENANSPYKFSDPNLQMEHFTGLQVAHEPGQWAVWAGVVLMGLSLVLVFYIVHERLWAIPVRDSRGRLLLWVGGMANKNKDAFEQRFRRLTQEIEAEIKQHSEPEARSVASLAAGH